jgi:hypothetical protein
MLLLVACDWDIFDLFPAKDQRVTNYHYMINPSGKRMIHELTFNVPLEHGESGGDSTLRHFSDGSNAQEELEWLLSYNVGTVRANPSVQLAYRDPFYLYNISDTSSLHWNKYWRQYDDSLKNFCPFYWIPGGETSDDKEFNWITYYYLMVSDSLLSLMQKDYTMLDKFKEYYANE